MSLTRLNNIVRPRWYKIQLRSPSLWPMLCHLIKHTYRPFFTKFVVLTICITEDMSICNIMKHAKGVLFKKLHCVNIFCLKTERKWYFEAAKELSVNLCLTLTFYHCNCRRPKILHRKLFVWGGQIIQKLGNHTESSLNLYQCRPPILSQYFPTNFALPLSSCKLVLIKVS